jgi:hypothetical protein
MDECRNILLHCNILCSQPSFTANMKKKTPDVGLPSPNCQTRRRVGIWYCNAVGL